MIITDTTVRPNTSVNFWVSPSDFSAEYENLFYATGKIITTKFWYTDELTKVRVTEYQSKDAAIEVSGFFNSYANGSLVQERNLYNLQKGITSNVVSDPPW